MVFPGLLIFLCQVYLCLSDDAQQAASCQAEIGFSHMPLLNGTRITCSNVGGDLRPLDEVLTQPLLDGLSESTSYSLDSLVDAVNFLYVQANGDVIINDNGLSKLKDLRSIEIVTQGKPRESRLSIPAKELIRLPQLMSLKLDGFAFDDNTMQALASVRHKLDSLTISQSAPASKILTEVAKFTNLTYRLELKGMCVEGSVPETIFRNSATKLNLISISYCNTNELTTEMFRGMNKLKHLTWAHSSILEIDRGAFDELINLQALNLNDNNLKKLPDGLFDKTQQLTHVDLTGNAIENLSPTNFSYCYKIEDAVCPMKFWNPSQDEHACCNSCACIVKYN